ncbi:MAG: trypsin-like peptidase domain-containing protein [Planctomycetes bacterium]|nr:trypsin-like peptidase domain-containing protein [Planctomycetota bacterium]
MNRIARFLLAPLLLPVAALCEGTATPLEDVIDRVLPTFVFIGGGSGVVIREDGTMLTNHHVTEGRLRDAQGQPTILDVMLSGGRPARARMIGTDPVADLSLLRILTDEPMAYAPFADTESIEPGETVFAIGNPFNLGRPSAQPTVTLGEVSANRAIYDNHRDGIMIDAPINPGNSGGPTFNERGEFVGINTTIATRFGIRANTGVGFAIPAHVIRRLLPSLEAGGVIRHADLPAGLQLDPTGAWGSGARIAKIPDGSGAAETGLAVGDVIERIGGLRILSAMDARIRMQSYPSGATVPVRVRTAAGETRETTLHLGDLPPPQSARLGVVLDPASARPTVASLTEGGAAQKAGVQPGDVILRIGRQAVPTGQHLIALLHRMRGGQTVPIVVGRGGEELTLRVTLGSESGDPRIPDPEPSPPPPPDGNE